MSRESARYTFVLGAESATTSRTANRTHAYQQPKRVNKNKEGPDQPQVDGNNCKRGGRISKEADADEQANTERDQSQGSIILLHEHLPLYKTRIGLPIVETPQGGHGTVGV